MVMKIADINAQTLVVYARYPEQYLELNGEKFYPERGIVRLYGTGEVWASLGSWWDILTIVNGQYPGPPFSGDMPGVRWLILPNDSKSETFRHAKLFRITDAVTSDFEEFYCVVRTKIYHYDTPSRYKRLFWWGIDAIYRQQATGRVFPVTYGSTVTWGEVGQRSWRDILSGTWRQPFVKGMTLETLRPEQGLSAQRKFAKFRKGLRFRQIQFEVEFDTDGSLNTAPVRLFSLHSEVSPAQTVSKSIT